MNDVRNPISVRFFTESTRSAVLSEIRSQYDGRESAIVIETQNTMGETYFLISVNKQVLFDDWNGDCEYVPENDAPVHMVLRGGNEVPHATTFEKTLLQLVPECA